MLHKYEVFEIMINLLVSRHLVFDYVSASDCLAAYHGFASYLKRVYLLSFSSLFSAFVADINVKV